MQIYIYPFL